MNPVLTKSGHRNFLLQYGKRVSLHILRYANDSKSEDIKLPPEPTTCCMSGCANCVWIAYAESVGKLLDGNTDKVRELVLNKIEDPNLRMFLSMEFKNIQYKSDLEETNVSSESTKLNNNDGTK